MIPIARPCIGDEEKKAVLDVLDSGTLAQGTRVHHFEDQFASFIGVKHAIATSNGTTALHAALFANNISAGDEVITSPFSFVATANTIKMVGAIPVFVDIDEQTFNLDVTLLEKAITAKTRAIMPVHLFGRAIAMKQITALAQKYNLIIIEDACQAHGAEVEGKKVGSFGTGCFSFYPTKNMTTSEGGMITTNDDTVAAKARKFISHGSEKRYHHDFVGYNFRMTDIAAAIGIEQLKKLLFFNELRRKNAAYLTDNLNHMQGIIFPEVTENNVFHQYTLRITSQFAKTREQFADYLTSQGIGNSIFYPIPIHKQKAYPEYNALSFPVAEKMATEVISIPVHPSLSTEDLHKIVDVIQNAA